MVKEVEMSSGPFRVVTYGEQLGIGVAGSRYLTIQAVAKTNNPNAPYCVPNEWICGVLGRFLGLPIPAAGIVGDPGDPRTFSFASLDFNMTGNVLPPILPTQCVDLFPGLATGVVLFDALVANADRHRGNLSIDLSATPPRLSVFDHSHALFGFDPGRGVERLAQLRDDIGVTAGQWKGPSRHCLLNLIPNDIHIGGWVDKVGRMPDFFIEDTCRAALDLGVTPGESRAAFDFIRYRRDRLPAIIEGHRGEFRSIAQWSPFP